RREIDHFPPVKHANRLLFPLQHTQLRSHALRPQILKRFTRVLQRIPFNRLRPRFTHGLTPNSPQTLRPSVISALNSSRRFPPLPVPSVPPWQIPFLFPHPIRIHQNLPRQP